jgi:hypothetical protein
MGYYVQLIDADFAVPESPEVLAAIHRMDSDWHALKRGGSFGPDGMEQAWFSWMPDVTSFTTVKDVFEALGFEVYVKDGSVYLNGYDNKTGQEELFLAAVAPFIEDGSFTSWRGEDGESYRYSVWGGKLTYQQAQIVWSSNMPFRYVHYPYLGVGSPMVAASVDVYSDVPVADQVAAAVKGAV